MSELAGKKIKTAPIPDFLDEPFDSEVYEAIERGMSDIENGRVVEGHKFMREIKEKLFANSNPEKDNN